LDFVVWLGEFVFFLSLTIPTCIVTEAQFEKMIEMGFEKAPEGVLLMSLKAVV
jgi:hypothetical protein